MAAPTDHHGPPCRPRYTDQTGVAPCRNWRLKGCWRSPRHCGWPNLWKMNVHRGTTTAPSSSATAAMTARRHGHGPVPVPSKQTKTMSPDAAPEHQAFVKSEKPACTVHTLPPGGERAAAHALYNPGSPPCGRHGRGANRGGPGSRDALAGHGPCKEGQGATEALAHGVDRQGMAGFRRNRIRSARTRHAPFPTGRGNHIQRDSLLYCWVILLMRPMARELFARKTA